MLRLSRFLSVAGTSKGAVQAGKGTVKRATGHAAVAPAKKIAAMAARDSSGVEAGSQSRGYGRLERNAGNDGQDSLQQEEQHASHIAAQQLQLHHDHRSAGKLHFDATKAGLQHVDKDYVEQVIQEASKGSAFYQKEQRLEETRRRKAQELQEKAKEFDTLSPSELQDLKARVDTLEDELEATRDLRRRYIHIDMDMFYAAVEEKKGPALRGKPFGVGSMQMLSTTNYIARQYGVRSGMPGFIGKKLCPELFIVPNDFPAYKREAARVHSIAARYDAQFVSVGLDELTMDVTKYLHEFPAVSASDIAHDFRDEVFSKTQLTSSGGIGPTSILAKIASNVNKPNGQHEITLLTREDVVNYVKDIPLRKIPGIGYAQELILGALNIHTCGDLLTHKYLLAYLFREKTFTHYLSVGLGVAETFSKRKHHATQSIGKETSFSEPLTSPEALTKVFRHLMEDCHARCVREHLKPRLMRLVLKYRTYDVEQFSQQLPTYTSDLKLWIEASQKLLEPHLLQYGDLRLIGVRVEKFEATDGEEAGSSEIAANGSNTSVAADIEADVESQRDGGGAYTMKSAGAEEAAAEAADEKQQQREEEERGMGEADNSNAEKNAGERADTKATFTAHRAAAEVTKKKRAPIPISKFLSRPSAGRAAAAAPPPMAERVAAPTGKSVKSARKHLKSSSGSAKRKLHKKR